MDMKKLNEHLDKQIGDTVTLSAKKLFYILAPEEDYNEIRYELLKLLKRLQESPPTGFIVDDILRVNNRLKVIFKRLN